MIYQWQCGHCEFIIWSAGLSTLRQQAEHHLLDHHQSAISNRESLTRWTCPYCDKDSYGTDEQSVIEQFRNHLFEHAERGITTDAHVADTINRVGNILLVGSPSSSLMDDVKIHLLTAIRLPRDPVVLITTKPKQRLELWADRIDQWPAEIRILTLTDADQSVTEADIQTIAETTVELRTINSPITLDQLGKTLTELLTTKPEIGEQIAVEFELLDEILAHYNLKPVFKFLYLMTTQIKRANGIAYYPVNPGKQDQMTLNLLENQFDLTISITDGVLKRE